MVKIGLEKIEADYLPEDLYYSLKIGSSTLHLADMDGEYGGFVVLTPLKTLSGQALHITAAYSTSIRKLTEYIPEIVQMARGIGAREITLGSTRNWEKYFSYKTTIYSMKV